MARKKGTELRKAFRAGGVYVFVMTPMATTRNRRGDLEVDLAGVEKNTAHFAGVPGEKTFVVCGGSGEFYSLTPGEVTDIAAAAVAGARGRCKIVCGIGGTDKAAVRMAQAIQETGVDAVLVMPHEAVSRRGDRAIWERHRAINRSLDIGFLPFRAPRQLLSIDLVKRFAEVPNVVAIKEESGAVDWVRTGCRVTGNAVPVITGGGEIMVPYYYLAGAVGFTTGLANLTLAKSIELHEAGIAKDWDRTMLGRDYFEPITGMRGKLGTPMLKAGLEMMGLAGGPVRATGAVLDASGRRKVRALLKERGLL